MEVEVKRVSGDHMAGDMPRVLARLDTAVDVADPTTLEQQISNWNQMRTLLTAYPYNAT